MTNQTKKIVTCPRCKKDCLFAPENPFRPFCSERCKLIDLGEWAQEKFRVPTEHHENIENVENEEEYD